MALVGHQQAVGTDGAHVARPQRVDDGHDDVVGRERAGSSVAQSTDRGAGWQPVLQHADPLLSAALWLAPVRGLAHGREAGRARPPRPPSSCPCRSPPPRRRAALDPPTRPWLRPARRTARGKWLFGLSHDTKAGKGAFVIARRSVGQPPARAGRIIAAEPAVGGIEVPAHDRLVGVEADPAQRDAELRDGRPRADHRRPTTARQPTRSPPPGPSRSASSLKSTVSAVVAMSGV